jgi:hypothetical protein
MLKITFSIILFFVFATISNCQVTVNNYTFTTSNTASLYDTSGSITIVGPHQFNVISDNILLPFLFAYDGTVHRLFNVSTFGEIAFSSISSNIRATILYPFAVRGNTDFSVNASGMGTSATGRICFKTIGNAPSRKAIISFMAMSIPKASGNNLSSFQVILHESIGQIDFVYGHMATTEILGFSNSAFRPTIGNGIFNRYKTVNTSNHTATNTTSLNNSFYTAGVINDLSSTGVNNCRQYSFTPPPLNNFINTAINFTSTNSGGTQYNVDHPNGSSIGYILLDSFSNSVRYLVQNTSAGSSGIHQRGFLPNGNNFYLKIFATNGGSISSNYAYGNYATTPIQTFISTKTGNWYDNTVWGTAPGVFPTLGDSVIIRLVDTVSINLTQALTGALVINGVLDFTQLGDNLVALRNIEVGANGILQANDRRYRGTSINETQGKSVTAGRDIFGPGLLDFRFNRSLLKIEETINSTSNNIQTAFATHNGVPILRNLSFSSSKPILLSTPVTVVESLFAESGTITTNNNLSFDHRISPTTPIPSAITVTRSSSDAISNGAINHGTGTNYNVNIAYLGGRTRIKPLEPVLPTIYIAGVEIPTNGIVARLVVASNLGVQLQQPITIKERLELEGNIDAQNNAITFGSGASQFYKSGGITTSNTITVTDNANMLFPFKHNGINRFFKPEINTGQQGTLSVQFFNANGITDFTNTYNEAGINFTSRYNFYWQVTNNLSGGFSNAASGTLTGLVTDLSNVVNPTKFGLSRINGQTVGAHSVSDYGKNNVRIKRENLRFSDVIGDYYMAFDRFSALPVKLLSFEGSVKNNYNQLNWKTTQEVNNKGFFIERSTDGVSYYSIGFTPASASSGNSNTYQFSDVNIIHPTYYYRLKQVDVNGSFSYTNIVKLTRHTNASIQVWPNPSTDYITVTLPKADLYTLLFFDASGKQLLEKKANTAIVKQEVKYWSNGMYYIKIIQNNTIISTLKFTKQ